jgi:hypothetical protein
VGHTQSILLGTLGESGVIFLRQARPASEDYDPT